MHILRIIIFSLIISIPCVAISEEPAVLEKEKKEEIKKETAVKDSKIEVTGILLERGTRAPVSRKVFYIIEKNNKKVRTDKEGKFKFSLVAGTYTLSFPIV